MNDLPDDDYWLELPTPGMGPARYSDEDGPQIEEE